MLKKEGYNSVADIPKDKIDDFWIMIDKGYESEAEKKGLKESYSKAILALSDGNTAEFINNIHEMMYSMLESNEKFKEYSDVVEKYSLEEKNIEIVKIEVTEKNKKDLMKLFKGSNSNVYGEVDDAKYVVYMSGVNKYSMGKLNIEITSYVDSNTMREKAKKEIISKLGLDKYTS